MLASIGLKIVTGIATKLLTETFIMKVLVAILGKVSEKTDNEIDDKIVKAVEEAYFGAK